jgi:hypothetical protein
VSEERWQELGVHPQRNRAAAAKKAVATRTRTGSARTGARKAAVTRKKSTAKKRA